MRVLPYLLLLSVFLSCFVSATRTEPNKVYDGVISNNEEIPGSNPITNVGIIGFTCLSQNCTTVNSANLFLDPVNTGSSNSYLINYPTFLRSSYGYGIYFYKDGWIPYEAISTWYGSHDPIPTQNRYLYKKQICFSNLNPLEITGNPVLGNTLTIKTKVYPAINHSGPLNYTPTQIADQYKHQVLTTLYIQNKQTGAITTQSINSNLEFSESRDIQFIFTPTTPGNYTLNITTSVPDAKCLNFEYRSSIIDDLEIISPPPIVTLPTISIISPENRVYTTNSVLININSANATNIWWSDGTTNYPYSTQTMHTFTDGTHTITAYANNSAGTSTATITFSINTTIVTPPIVTLPTISIISPENRVYTTNSVLININSANATNIWWSDGIANFTYISPLNYNFLDGTHTITAYANNSAGLAFSRVSFSVNTNITNPPTDTTAPIIIIINPVSNIQYNSNNLTLEIITDEPAIAFFSLDNAANIAMNALNSTHFTFNLTNLAEGSHSIMFYAIDLAGNTANSLVTFSISLPNIPNPPQTHSSSKKCNKKVNETIIILEEIKKSGNANNSIYLMGEENLNNNSKQTDLFYIILLIILNILVIFVLIRLLLSFRTN